MKPTQRRQALIWLSCALAFVPASSFAESGRKRSRSDRDIHAIGNRKVAYLPPERYPLQAERTMGGTESAAFEQSTSILKDEKTQAFVERLAKRIADNSDVQMPITIRILDRAEVDEFVLPGGHLYVTHGLLLKVQSEGELASALARGVAHTALRSALYEIEKKKLMRILFAGTDLGMDSLLILDLKRREELDADYYGVQYLYKAGYDPECFVDFLKSVSVRNSASGSSGRIPLSPFPPLRDRLKALEKEIRASLPMRDGAVRTTPEFKEFHEWVLGLPLPKPEGNAGAEADSTV